MTLNKPAQVTFPLKHTMTISTTDLRVLCLVCDCVLDQIQTKCSLTFTTVSVFLPVEEEGRQDKKTARQRERQLTH